MRRSPCVYLFSGDFLFCTTFTDHRVLGTDLIMCLRKEKKKKIDLKMPKMRPAPPPRSNRRDIFNLDVFEVKRFLAVFAVERPLRALALVVALLLVEADVFFAGGAGDDHELALALVVELERAERQWSGGLGAGPRARRVS